MVGAGPNGLAAAITLARAGLGVRVLEANETIGGACRSAELTLPGFVHDTCSSVHALAAASPFMRELRLESLGVELVHPELPLAQALPGGRAAVLRRSLEETAAALDDPGYLRLMRGLVRRADTVVAEVLSPLRAPRHPVALTAFGVRAAWPADLLARAGLRRPDTRTLFAGIAAHSGLPLGAPFSAAFGLMLAMTAHSHGWPVAGGGSQKLADALAETLGRLGGEIETGRRVGSMGDLPEARIVLFDLTPRQVLAIAGDQLPGGYRRRLEAFRYGPGVFKVDWALSEPIPWSAAACRGAGTVHLGRDPFVILVQPTVCDRSRAPAGKHTAWAYCHVPNGSDRDMTAAIEAEVERVAPGFREVVLARSTMSARQSEGKDANLVGGDINGGLQDLAQIFMRPAPRLDPYSTPNPRLYLCSSSTPPGGGVHGMCGHLAARSALRRIRARS